MEAGEGRTLCYRNCFPQPSGAAGFGDTVLLALVYAASSAGDLTGPSEQLLEQFLKKKQLIPVTEVAYLLCKTYSVGVLRLAVFVKQYRLEASQLKGLLSLALLEALTASEQNS